MTNKLSRRRRKFVNEYTTNNFNATQAALKAGYSEATAYSQGQRLLKNVEVENEINKQCKAIAEGYPVLRKKIIEKLQKMAFSDIKDYLSYKTIKTEVAKIEGVPILGYKTVIDLINSDDIDGTLIYEVSETRDGFKFKRSDPLKALELLGKYTGLEYAELDDLRIKIEKMMLKWGEDIDDAE
jgi:phage terminase small subunit